MIWDLTNAQTQLTDHAHMCANGYVHIQMYVCVLGFLLIYMNNIIPFIYISITRFPTALGCLLFLSRDIGQEADRSCFTRLRHMMLTCIPAKLLVHKALSRQKLHGTDSELFSQGRRYSLAVAASPSALNM